MNGQSCKTSYLLSLCTKENVILKNCVCSFFFLDFYFSCDYSIFLFCVKFSARFFWEALLSYFYSNFYPFIQGDILDLSLYLKNLLSNSQCIHNCDIQYPNQLSFEKEALRRHRLFWTCQGACKFYSTI